MAEMDNRTLITDTSIFILISLLKGKDFQPENMGVYQGIKLSQKCECFACHRELINGKKNLHEGDILYETVFLN